MRALRQGRFKVKVSVNIYRERATILFLLFSFSRHRRLMHGIIRTTNRSKNQHGLVLVPMYVPKNREQYHQLASNFFPSSSADMSASDLCRSMDKIIDETEVELILNVMRELIDHSCIIQTKNQLKTFFELALISLEKDEASETRRRNRWFEKISLKLFPNGFAQG